MSTAGEYGPCATCHTAGAAAGPYTLWHRVPLCPTCLETAHRSEDLAAHPADPVTTAGVAAAIDSVVTASDAILRVDDSVVTAIGNGQTDHPEALIDWPAFWARDRTAPEWLIEPIIPAGKSVALYAKGGLGKSELLLALCAAAACGRRTLGRTEGTPLRTLYLDAEQTEDDVYDRLIDLGYGPDDDLGPLVYCLLPDLPPLDTHEGGDHILELATGHKADLVVIDTTARVLEGAENDADTIRNYYRWTGRPLKAAGFASVRIDHAGKDSTKGMRGTSAKNDDVDVVWRLTHRDKGTRLTAEKRRANWLPHIVDLVRLEYPLRYELALQTWPEGTSEVAWLLDALEVPVEVSRRSAAKAVRESGEKWREATIGAAVKWRQEPGYHPGNRSPDTTPGTTPGTTLEPGEETLET